MTVTGVEISGRGVREEGVASRSGVDGSVIDDFDFDLDFDLFDFDLDLDLLFDFDLEEDGDGCCTVSDYFCSSFYI